MKYFWLIFIATGIGFFIGSSYGAIIGFISSILIIGIRYIIFRGLFPLTLVIIVVIGAIIYGYYNDGVLGAFGGLVEGTIIAWLIAKVVQLFKEAINDKTPNVKMDSKNGLEV